MFFLQVIVPMHVSQVDLFTLPCHGCSPPG